MLQIVVLIHWGQLRIKPACRLDVRPSCTLCMQCAVRVPERSLCHHPFTETGMAVLELHSFQLEGGRIQAAEPELVTYGLLGQFQGPRRGALLA